MSDHEHDHSTDCLGLMTPDGHIIDESELPEELSQRLRIVLDEIVRFQKGAGDGYTAIDAAADLTTAVLTKDKAKETRVVSSVVERGPLFAMTTMHHLAHGVVRGIRETEPDIADIADMVERLRDA